MNISVRVASLRLTPQGDQIMEGACPTGRVFDAFVIDTDPTGAWIVFPKDLEPGGSGRLSMLLVRWEHVGAFSFDYKPEPEVPIPPRPAIGFRPAPPKEKD